MQNSECFLVHCENALLNNVHKSTSIYIIRHIYTGSDRGYKCLSRNKHLYPLVLYSSFKIVL